MAPRIHSAELETRTARAKLAVRRKPYGVRIAPGVKLAYRRNKGAGTWSVACADGAGGEWIKKVGLADDMEDADGKDVMSYWQAMVAARQLARATDGDHVATSHIERSIAEKAKAFLRQGIEPVCYCTGIMIHTATCFMSVFRWCHSGASRIMSRARTGAI
jgi:hypothetical protein